MVEFISLAFHLFEAGEADEWLTRLSNIGDDEPCALLEDDQSKLPEGGCRYYQFRPMICRLFGFSAAIVKNNILSPILCRLVKSNSIHSALDNLSLHITERLSVLSEFALRILNLDPYQSGKHYPINLSLKKVLEYVGLNTYLNGLSEAIPSSEKTAKSNSHAHVITTSSEVSSIYQK